MGVLVQTHPELDDQSRAYIVRLRNGGINRRPMQLLSALEFSTLLYPDILHLVEVNQHQTSQFTFVNIKKKVNKRFDHSKICPAFVFRQV